MNIHVANIGRTVIADDLRDAFTRFGIVVSATLVKDKFTPKSLSQKATLSQSDIRTRQV
jgi:RNA recognition motif-containing protein